jgi:IS5 family transposase
MVTASSTKNKEGERDSEMHQTKKGSRWQVGMKARIGVDVQSGLVYTVVGTAANANHVTQAAKLLHGKDAQRRGDADHQGVDKRREMKGSKAKVKWQVAMRRGKRNEPDSNRRPHKLLEKAERLKVSVRAKVEHPFRAINLLMTWKLIMDAQG